MSNYYKEKYADAVINYKRYLKEAKLWLEKANYYNNKLNGNNYLNSEIELEDRKFDDIKID